MSQALWALVAAGLLWSAAADLSADWGVRVARAETAMVSGRLEAPGATAEQLETLRRILDRPEFRAAEGRSWLDQTLDPIRRLIRATTSEWIRWLLRLLYGPGAGNAVTAGIALVIVLIGGLVVLRLSRGALAVETELARAKAAGPPRAQEELAQADSLARAGDLRGAVHHRYLAALRRLDERELLTLDRSLTNRELLPRAAGNPAAATALSPLVTTFDQLWYGQSTCSFDEYGRFAELADRVWTAAG